MTTLAFESSDWEDQSVAQLLDVTVVSVTAELITVNVDLGDSKTAQYLLAGSFAGISGTDLSALTGTITGLSLQVDFGAGFVEQFSATGLSFDVTELDEESFTEVHDLLELALGDDDSTMNGSDEGDNLDGQNGDDLLDGGLGDDLLDGGEGEDNLDGGEGEDNLDGGMGDDLLDGGEGDDHLDGGEGEDDLDGGLGDDDLVGGMGDDHLDGGEGTDDMNGGDGDDTYVVDDESDTITDSSGIDTVECSINFTLASFIEKLVLLGTALIGIGNELDNDITGNDEDNSLSGEDGIDMLDGGAGDDDLSGGIGDDHCHGGIGNDNIDGGTGNDTLDGGTGGDRLDGGAGNDGMAGGAGNDVYVVNAAGDAITESAGAGGGIDTEMCSISDTLEANVENLVLTGKAALNGTGNALNNTLTGNTGANRLSGGAGTDKLLGGAGADNLMGGLGNDTLTGGAGKDSLTGGAGKDVFDFNALAEMGSTKATADIITDFQRGIDDIDLSGLDANLGAAGNNAFKFIGAGDFTAAGQLKFVGGVLYGNIDSDSQAEFAIQLSGASTLSASDFIL